MKTSDTGIQLIKSFEGLHDGDLTMIGLQPKLCPAGVWTAGYGRALVLDGKQIKADYSLQQVMQMFPLLATLTEADAEKMLRKDLLSYEITVKRNVKRALQQHEFDALVSHTYNTGGSKTLFALAEKQSPAIKDWFLTRYITANGKQLAGLVKRRKAEWVLYSTAKLEL